MVLLLSGLIYVKEQRYAAFINGLA